MQPLAAGEHLDELRDPPGARLRALGVVDAVQDRVAVVAVELARTRPSRAGSASRARWRSSGTWMSARRSYAASHRPSAFARSTSASPAGRIRPSAMRRSTFSRLIFDHFERERRGVNRCRKYSRRGPALPVDPAEAQARLDRLRGGDRRDAGPFLAIRIHSPGGGVVLLEPGLERLLVREGELGQVVGHPCEVTAARPRRGSCCAAAPAAPRPRRSPRSSSSSGNVAGEKKRTWSPRGSKCAAKRRRLSASASSRPGPWCGVLASSSPPGRSTRRTSESHGASVDDVLEHLARPRDVEGGVLRRERLAVRPQTQVERRVALGGAPQRLTGDVDAHRHRARLAQRRGELAGAAAQVEHPRAALHVAEQPVAPGREVLGDRAEGDLLPDRLGELAHVAGRRDRSFAQPP